MSIKLMSEVWECDLARADQAVLLVMADHARDDGTRCFPSVGLIAWKTGFSERTVQYALRRLEHAGVLVRARVERPGQYQPLEYAICLNRLTRKPPFTPKHAQPSGASLAPLPEPPGVQSATGMGANGDGRGANDDGRGANGDGRGANDDGRGAIAIAPEPSVTINEPPKEPSRAFARDAAVARLEQTFAALAHIPLPERATGAQQQAAGKRWWNPLADLWRVCGCETPLAENLMRRAIGRMRRDKLTLSAPASIYAVAVGLYGEDHATTHQQSYPEGAELARRRRAVAEAGTFADAEPG